MRIRRALPEELPTIHQLIRAPALYELAPEMAQATPEQLRESFYSDAPNVFCDVVETDQRGWLVSRCGS